MLLQKLTGLKRENFRGPTINVRTNKSGQRPTRLPHGTAHVTIISNENSEKGVKLYRRLSAG